MLINITEFLANRRALLVITYIKRYLTLIMFNVIMAMSVTATLVMFLFLCSPSAAILLSRLQLPSPVTGPESLAFDRNGGGPYVSSSDGRIFKYVGPNEGFKEYASTSPIR